MSQQFKGRRVVVCGGSKGIGRSIALGFAAARRHVSICARGADALEGDRGRDQSQGVTAHSGTCDLADGAASKSYIASAGKALGGIDVLVNNASGFGMTDDEAGWAAGINVDMMATVRASHAALPLLEKPAPARRSSTSSRSRPTVRACAPRPTRR